jgi:hypothetical protein
MKLSGAVILTILIGIVVHVATYPHTAEQRMLIGLAMSIAVFYIPLCIAVALVADRKGSSCVGWYFFSVVFTPLIAILFVIALPMAKPQVNVRQYGASAVAAELFGHIEPERKPWPVSLIFVGVIAAVILGFALISSGAIAAESTMQRDQPTTVFRDSRGSITGRASTDSQGTIKFYDARGNVTGSASSSGGRR